ncbi:hypothetical protein IF650_08450 [Cellulosimicrobium terreum]|nr:hypothetical protein [Cellulosimicrobium terreum]
MPRTSTTRPRPGARSDRGGAGRPAPAPPARRTARRWLQGRTPWQRIGLALVALLLVGALVVLVVVLVSAAARPATTTPGGLAVDPARVAELEAAEEQHDAENLVASVDHATRVQTELVPVLHDLHEVLPVDGSTPREPTGAEVASWRETLVRLTEETEALASGSSEHNIVRNGLLISLQLLTDTVDTVDLARTAGPAESEQAARLSALAGDLRTRAVDTWALAAVQLDLRSTGAGQGHVHLFLPVHPEDSLDGGLGTDGSQDAHDH